MTRRSLRLPLLGLNLLAGFAIACGGTDSVNTPPPPPPSPGSAVAAIGLLPPTVSLTVGASTTLTAIAVNGAGQQVTPSLNWKSSKPNIASVDGSGRVTAVAQGDANITATSGSVVSNAAVVSVTVDLAATVDSLVLNLDSAEVILGDTARLVAVPRNAAGQTVPGIQLVWTSSDPSVLAVSSTGLLTAVDFGEAEIEVAIAVASPSGVAANLPFANSGSRSRTKKAFQVVPIIEISNPGNRTIDVGASVTYGYRLFYIDGNGKKAPYEKAVTVRWKSSAPGVASIDPISGVARGLTRGSTTVTATATTGKANVQGTYDKSTGPSLLRVEICSNLLGTPAWDATVSTLYKIEDKVFEDLKFNIDQKSNGTATLSYKNTITTGDIVDVWWEGVVSGTVHVENKVERDPFETDEWVLQQSDASTGTALLALSLVTLRVRSTGSECSYSVRYQDQFDYEHKSFDPFQLTTASRNFTAITGHYGVPANSKPDGGWLFEKTVNAPDLFSVGEPVPPEEDELAILQGQAFYAPKTSIPLVMFSVSPGTVIGSVGAATFHYKLVGHP